MNYEKMFTVFVDVIKRKLKRLKEQKKEIESLIDQGIASSRQKQDFVEIRAKIEAYEDVIDIADSMMDKENERT